MAKEREVRIAAIADLHVEPGRNSATEILTDAGRDADVLVLCGDLTNQGTVEQFEALARDIEKVRIPVVAVFGNHDHEAEVTDQATTILEQAGARVLDGDSVVIDGVGFAGVKGFAGGFGRGTLAPFGERLIKDFVRHAIDEALKLENALRRLDTDTKVVLMHYSPIVETLQGEPEQIYPFLGSSRLLTPIETYNADVVFHGHAHSGTAEGRTPSGIPVYNVSLPVLQREGQLYRIHLARAPERRLRAS